MKLIARIKRIRIDASHILLKAEFPRGTPKAALPDSVVANNIGPRPWAEGYYVDSAGRKIVLYWRSRA